MFHSLARPDGKHPLTTEQALRRLYALGFTCNDAPIQKTLRTLSDCLQGKRKIDGYSEKGHDWEHFTRMMLSAWVRRFGMKDASAADCSERWAFVMEEAFSGGSFQQAKYLAAYRQVLSSTEESSRALHFCNFYPLCLLPGLLKPATESAFLDYVLSRPDGVYYLYGQPLNILPAEFASLQTVRWLSAMELLSHFPLARNKLAFAAEWLDEHRLSDGRWDLGPKANDGIYLPLSDSWRKADTRIADCTEWISTIMENISGTVQEKSNNSL